MTNLGALRKIGKFLVKQGKQAHDGTSCCNWMVDEDGKQLNCAVGCLIPKEYLKQIDSNESARSTVRDLTQLARNRRKVPALLHLDMDTLIDAQRVHDDAEDPSGFVAHIKGTFLNPKSQLSQQAIAADAAGKE